MVRSLLLVPASVSVRPGAGGCAVGPPILLRAAVLAWAAVLCGGLPNSAWASIPEALGRTSALPRAAWQERAGPGSADEAARLIGRLRHQLGAARTQAVHLLAPAEFERAEARLGDAERRLASGRTDVRLAELLDEAAASLVAGEQRAGALTAGLSDALQLRAAAITIEAHARDARLWRDAESRLEDAARQAARGQADRSRQAATEAENAYREIHWAAFEELHLGAAVAGRAAATAAHADSFAPKTFAAADSALTLARGLLRGAALQLNEGSRAEAGVTAAGDAAATATFGFRRAVSLAVLGDSAAQDSGMVEALLLSHEADLLSLASLAGVEEVPDGLTGEVTAGTGAARITRSIAAEVGALLADNERLGAALPVARRRADSLAAALAGTERRLREAEDRYLEARATLDALQADDARLREAMGLFTPAEGDVLLAGGDLVLRLHGINFESGVAEVGEGAEAILAKARQVIATFPNASVRVEGHTDATGGADANRVLSQRRAAAVREHLLRRLPIPASMMSAAGFGADRPISTNDTEEGRALNRRIEIVLTLPDR